MGPQTPPVAGIGGKAVAAPHIPFDSHLPTRQLPNLDVHPRSLRLEGGVGMEMGNAVLPFHSVVGLAAIDPVAIDADAHAA
jgi:hypothetical protein